ncbi:MAG: Holliday junction branch migration protein RuvA [Ignavibacteriales bacterium]|nr:Holliday junction branch migration protein RuvA [Ignavibacteriales bacterium]
MIAYLEGAVKFSKPTELVVNAGGVGYLVYISLSTYEAVAGKNTVELFIHTVVREDAINLYGFAAIDEKELFELLISVSGIGPKSALSVLSGIRPNDLRQAIALGDVGRLTSAPGIGKKTAERLVLELRNKIDSLPVAATDIAYPVRSEAIAALTSLGYNQRAAEKFVRELLDVDPNLKLEDLLKQALKKMSV